MSQPATESIEIQGTDSMSCAMQVSLSALDKHAIEVVVLDVQGICDIADALVICTSSSSSQTKAIGDAVVEGLSATGRKPWHIDGLWSDSWVLVDGVDVVIHIFSPTARAFYALESLWADAPRLETALPAT